MVRGVYNINDVSLLVPRSTTTSPPRSLYFFLITQNILVPCNVYIPPFPNPPNVSKIYSSENQGRDNMVTGLARSFHDAAFTSNPFSSSPRAPRFIRREKNQTPPNMCQSIVPAIRHLQEKKICHRRAVKHSFVQARLFPFLFIPLYIFNVL